ncbi:GNAT family N-acetyltransferase [Streptomyces bungoensis]|uniref:GNAT family N-acetyltransferase n=1 Tax=Streptomyces bungoensis TaxID=285568 RepID=UPI003F54E650
MASTDASAGTWTGSIHPGRFESWDSECLEDVGNFTGSEDTLELRLPRELVALLAEGTADGSSIGREGGAGFAGTRTGARAQGDTPGWRTEAVDDLLDHVSGWGPTATPVGSFQLVPVQIERDLPLVHRWMNDPPVAAFWQLAGPPSATESHLRAQLAGDGRSVPCLGVLEGTPMSYWEIYRADLDPLAPHYPARPHDTGIHLLVGDAAHRGRGLGSALLRAVADQILDRRPACTRVVAEPDLHNTLSVAAFLSAGFRFTAEVELPGKRAALMIRDRVLRHLM